MDGREMRGREMVEENDLLMKADVVCLSEQAGVKLQ